MPVINVCLELLQIFWNLAVLLCIYSRHLGRRSRIAGNLAVQVYNALVPLIGMLIYIVYALFITIVTEVVQILGEIDIWSLFQPLMGILQELVSILTAIIQAVVAIAPSVLAIAAKIIGVVIAIIAEQMKIMLPILTWLLKILFAILEPILQVIVDIVNWFLGLFGLGMMMKRKLMAAGGDDPLLLEEQSPYDTFQEDFYTNVATKATRYMSKGERVARQTELDHIADYLQTLPPRSFGYYWTITRLHPSSVDYPSPEEAYLGEDAEQEKEERAGVIATAVRRRLLSEAEARELVALSAEEDAEEEERRAAEAEEYWRAFDRDPAGAHDLWSARHYERSRATIERLGKYRRLHRRLLEAEREDLERHDRELMALGNDTERPPLPVANVHAFSGELHRHVLCTSPLCGGHGKALPHAVLTLRRKNDEHEAAERARHRRAVPKTREQAARQERRRKDDFVLASAAVQAGRAASKTLFEHLRGEHFARAVRSAWNHTVGPHHTFQSASEQVAMRYSDGYEIAADLTDGLAAWAPIKRIWDMHTPETLEGRRPFHEWRKTNRVRRAVHPKTGRSLMYVEAEEVSVERPDGTTCSAYRAAGDGTPMPVGGDCDGGQFAVRELLAAQGGGGGTAGASVPLFALFTQTDCYTTDPRNPLCLPELPGNAYWTGPPLVLVWPANATGDTFCDYLFSYTPRDLADYRTYIDGAHVWNGIQWCRVFFSFLVPLTTLIGNFVATMNFWPIYYLDDISAFPPGHDPTGTDIICWLIHTYDFLLDVTLGYLFAVYAWPVLMWLWTTGAGLYLLALTFVAADDARAQVMEQEGRNIARKIAYTTDVNSGYSYYGDPTYFKTDPETGIRLRPGMPAYERGRADALRAATANQTPWDGAGAVPPNFWSQHERLNRRFGEDYYDPGDGSPPQPRSPADLQAAFSGAARDSDDHLPPPGQRPFYRDEAALARLQTLERSLSAAARAFGRPPSGGRDHRDLVQFEQAHNLFLQSYCNSLWWIYQAENRKRDSARKDWRSRPAPPTEKRGFTHHTTEPMYDASGSFATVAASLRSVRERARLLREAWRRSKPPAKPPAAAGPPKQQRMHLEV